MQVPRLLSFHFKTLEINLGPSAFQRSESLMYLMSKMTIIEYIEQDLIFSITTQRNPGETKLSNSLDIEVVILEQSK